MGEACFRHDSCDCVMLGRVTQKDCKTPDCQKCWFGTNCHASRCKQETNEWSDVYTRKTSWPSTSTTSSGLTRPPRPPARANRIEIDTASYGACWPWGLFFAL